MCDGVLSPLMNSFRDFCTLLAVWRRQCRTFYLGYPGWGVKPGSPLPEHVGSESIVDVMHVFVNCNIMTRGNCPGALTGSPGAIQGGDKWSIVIDPFPDSGDPLATLYT